MASLRRTIRGLAALTLWAGFGLTAAAQVPVLTVDKAFEVKPRQPGVTVPTPAPDQVARYRLEPIPNQKSPGTNMGYVVRDEQNRPVRQFVSFDNKSFNVVAFYSDGVEVYREVFDPTPTAPYQFRWLGPNGSKWGIDRDRDGRIDEWGVISPEEVGQELLQAVIARDAKRLEALLVTKENLAAIGLPEAEQQRLRDRATKAAQKLLAAADELKLTPEAKWIHLESGTPQATAGDTFGSQTDLVVHKNAIVLIQDGKDTKFLQTGELVLVGRSWKVIDGPTAGVGTIQQAGPTGPTTDAGPVIIEAIKGDVAELDTLDKTVGSTADTQDKITAYYAKRVVVLERIVQKVPADQQTGWVRLLLDSLTTAAEGGKADGPHLARLRQLAGVLGGNAQSPLAPYSAFRLATAENTIAMRDAGANPKDIQAAQDKCRERLEGFYKKYPNAEDAPEALLRLATSFEYGSKESDAKAKEWYELIVKNHATHPHAAKARGSIKRLDSEGKTFELAGPVLGTGQPLAVAALGGKVVVVYYWASWVTTLEQDAKKLKELAAAYGPKGFEVVTVCLDDDPQAGLKAAQAVQLPGVHLHQRGTNGGDSPLATAYGINNPPHAFLVGKDGKVVNKSATVLTLDSELKPLFPEK
ncbi:MAG: redoxin family protein [Gemmataceae bacterium]|nr:redoxin family protein [Gemmataceae bacterium]